MSSSRIFILEVVFIFSAHVKREPRKIMFFSRVAQSKLRKLRKITNIDNHNYIITYVLLGKNHEIKKQELSAEWPNLIKTSIPQLKKEL